MSNIDNEQHPQKKATDNLRRDAMPYSDEVRSAEPLDRSPDTIDPVQSAEPLAHNHDANELVRSAELSARSRVASDCVRSADNAVLNPPATVYKPLATDVIRSVVTSDVPDISNATYVVPTP